MKGHALAAVSLAGTAGVGAFAIVTGSGTGHQKPPKGIYHRGHRVKKKAVI
jgi:hypothetical protein